MLWRWLLSNLLSKKKNNSNKYVLEQGFFAFKLSKFLLYAPLSLKQSFRPFPFHNELLKGISSFQECTITSGHSDQISLVITGDPSSKFLSLRFNEGLFFRPKCGKMSMKVHLLYLKPQLMLIWSGAIILPSVLNPWIILPAIPLVAVFVLIARYYLKSARYLRRLEGVNRSPVISHFSDTLEGLVAIRAYKRDKFLKSLYRFV